MFFDKIIIGIYFKIKNSKSISNFKLHEQIS